jgi:long-chain fatty acid transport protein
MGFTSLPRKTLLAVMLAGSFTAAHATNGYFAHGYGIKAKGMGGASVAMTHDAFAGANNPAAAAFAGKRWDLGVELFSPRRSIERSGSEFFAPEDLDGKENSRENYFLIPEFGYNNQLSDTLAINLTVYGNGGMNTNFKGENFACPDFFMENSGNLVTRNAHCGNGKLGVNLEQLIIAPTVALKVAPNHSLGISPLLVYQRFKAYGLDAFVKFGVSENGTKLTNKGNSSSMGLGVRVGYMGKLNDQITIGAAYAPKINMSKFSKYKGLFAEGGDFDIPASYTVGVAIQATPTVLVALDHQKIKYSGVDSVSNPSTNFGAEPLGSDNGPGFGWKDVSVWKLGAQWQASPTWTLRAGYNKGDNPIRSRDVTFNMLAPGVVKDHYTLGGTMALDKVSEMSFFYMHAKSETVKGNSLLSGLAPDFGTDKIKMYQNSIGIQYSKKF